MQTTCAEGLVQTLFNDKWPANVQAQFAKEAEAP